MRRLVWSARVTAGLLSTAGLGLVAAPAQAAALGEVSLHPGPDGSYVRYVAAKNATNKVVITRSGNTVTIDDRVKIKAGTDCTAVKGDKTKVRCTSPDTTEVRMWLFDKGDAAVNRTSLMLNVYGGSGNDSITGGSQRDLLRGESGNDKIWGQGGRDKLYGDSGSDRLYGGTGIDDIYNGNGTDVVYGNSGSDRLHGSDGDGNDKLYGGTGNDQFMPARNVDGADLFVGNSGTDAVHYWWRDLPVSADLDGAKGDDGAKGERDTISADIENLSGGQGHDVLRGDKGRNVIRGQWGNDRIYGGGGNDTLDGESTNDQIWGQSGNDTLIGGVGEDRMYGGAGNDTLNGDDIYIGELDRLDGGANTDVCQAFAPDVRVNCER
ncbi:calcium-binding protein [Actinoplanes sp. NPDC024001]|uniref:calcium-binding protein n=1 Tax=Actinoplanes sp. NPDC024001 TaxID=3154598 RepID=UPI0033F450E5